MLLVFLFEFFVFVAIILAAHQMIAPLFRGFPIFPIFRKKRKLIEELAKASEKVEEKKIEKKIKEMRKRKI